MNIDKARSLLVSGFYPYTLDQLWPQPEWLGRLTLKTNLDNKITVAHASRIKQVGKEPMPHQQSRSHAQKSNILDPDRGNWIKNAGRHETIDIDKDPESADRFVRQTPSE